METIESFGDWVRRRRRMLDLSQEALAQRIGCARITIQKIEAGERRPSREFAALLADRLVVPLSERDAFVRAARSDLVMSQLNDPTHLAANHIPARSGASRLTTPPGNLPAHLTPCIGRERELVQIGDLLTNPNCRLITVTGLGGVGKTCFATEAARTQTSIFPNGAWFVPLAAVKSVELLEVAVADVLGVAYDPGASRRKQLSYFLRDKRLLVIFDNAEHIIAILGEMVAQLLRDAPDMKVIITSRERLRLPGEWLIDLGGLICPQTAIPASLETAGAAQLFAYHAHMVRPDLVLGPHERVHVARLCQLLEGLPLAIELAASWMRILSCQAITEQVTRGFDIAALTPRGKPARHRSLRAVFSHSWHLLSDRERVTLRRLAVFHSPFTSSTAEEVADASSVLLAALLDVSLLRRFNSDHFELHPLIRQYAAEYLAEASDEQERTLAQHAMHFAALIQALASIDEMDIPYELLEGISAVFVDVRAAWEWALRHRKMTLIEQMFEGMWVYLKRQSLNHEGVRLFERASLAFEAIGQSDSHIHRLVDKLRVRQAFFYLSLALPEQARRLFEQGLVAARQVGDLPEVALCLEHLGTLAMAQGAYDEAQRSIVEALNLCEMLGNEHTASILRSILGLMAYDQGEYQAAHTLCQAALTTVARSCTHGLRRAIVTMRLGYVEYALGNYQIAQVLIEAALVATEDAGRTFGTVHLYCPLGLILAAQGKYIVAEHALREGLKLARAFDYPFGIALVLNHLGYVLNQHGAYAEAQALLEEALTLCEAAGNHTGIAYARMQLGDIACAIGNETQAEYQLGRALQTAAAISAVPLILDILVGLATLAMRRCQLRKAQQLVQWPIIHPASRAVTRERATQLGVMWQLEVDASTFVSKDMCTRGLTLLLNELLEPLGVRECCASEH